MGLCCASKELDYLLEGSMPLCSPPRKGEKVLFRVTHVIDGDTLKGYYLADGKHGKLQVLLRLADVDAPELRRAEQEQAAKVVRQWLSQRIQFSERCVVEALILKWDKYGGRVVGNVFVKGEDVGHEMIQHQLVHSYSGLGPKPPWSYEELKRIEAKSLHGLRDVL
jgi:endonuclease YncB( thermonuclease family)